MSADIQSIEDVLGNPELLRNKSWPEIQAIVVPTPGWIEEKLGKGSQKGKGWVFREYNSDGLPTGRLIRWHPGGGHHGPMPYWRVNTYQSKSPIIPAAIGP